MDKNLLRVSKGGEMMERLTIDEAEKIRKVVENNDYIAQLVNASKTLIEAFENLIRSFPCGATDELEGLRI